MVDGLAFVVGIGIAATLMYLISIQLNDEEHGILKLLLTIGILIMLLFLPKILGDATNTCVVVVSNSTIVSSSITSYEYESFCYTEPTTSVTTFMKVIFWIFRGVILYILVYLFWQAIKAIGVMRGKKNG